MNSFAKNLIENLKVVFRFILNYYTDRKYNSKETMLDDGNRL